MSVQSDLVAAVRSGSLSVDEANLKAKVLFGSGVISIEELCEAVSEIGKASVKQGGEWGKIGLSHSENGNLQFTNCGMSQKWRNLNIRPCYVNELVSFIRSADFDALLAKEMATPEVRKALAESNLPTEEKKALSAQRAAAAAKGPGQTTKPVGLTSAVYIDDTSAGWIVGPFPSVGDAETYQRTVPTGRLGKAGKIVAPGMAEYPAVAAAGAEAVDAKTASEQSV